MGIGTKEHGPTNDPIELVKAKGLAAIEHGTMIRYAYDDTYGSFNTQSVTLRDGDEEITITRYIKKESK